jgi:hypothetical protein
MIPIQRHNFLYNRGPVFHLRAFDRPTTVVCPLQPRPFKTRPNCHRSTQWQLLRASTDEDGIAAILHDPPFRALAPRGHRIFGQVHLRGTHLAGLQT